MYLMLKYVYFSAMKLSKIVIVQEELTAGSHMQYYSSKIQLCFNVADYTTLDKANFHMFWDYLPKNTGFRTEVYNF